MFWLRHALLYRDVLLGTELDEALAGGEQVYEDRTSPSVHSHYIVTEHEGAHPAAWQAVGDAVRRAYAAEAGRR